MRREFTEDGWRFRVTVHTSDYMEDRVKVQFYDNTIHRPEVEDVYSLEVTPPKTTETYENELFSIGPWSFTTTETREVPYEDTDEMVEDGLDRAWERIETIEQSPSQQLDETLSEYER